ncbi:MAG: hypothetical protein JWP48_5262 [Actinoallomurus sp.]|nr:hypothetical protein [Actinoallomurus sp.]
MIAEGGFAADLDPVETAATIVAVLQGGYVLARAFYLWLAAAGMNRFLWGGGGFQGIVADFGRPYATGPVSRWSTDRSVRPRPASPPAVPGPSPMGRIRR